MAEKRMFAKKVVDSDKFLDMPISARLLYYDLGMRADDDGFVDSPKKIMRMISANQDDMKILIEKGFVIAFDTGVVCVSHWRCNNTIGKDRYTPTQYQSELSMLELGTDKVYRWKQDVNSLVTECKQIDTNLVHQIREDKISIDKNREEESTPPKPEKKATVIIDYAYIFDQYNLICRGMTAVQKQSDSRKKAIKTRLTSGYTVQDIVDVFQRASQSSFLKGNNNRGWRADFDWLLKPDNMVKVLEGKYDDYGGNTKNVKYDDEYYRQLEEEGKPVF